MDGTAGIVGGTRQPIEIEQEVFFSVEADRTVVAPLDDVERNLGEDQTGSARHPLRLRIHDVLMVTRETIVVCPLLFGPLLFVCSSGFVGNDESAFIVWPNYKLTQCRWSAEPGLCLNRFS